MPILFRPLEAAPESYAQDKESRFRRELENYLLRLSSEVNGASSAQATEASLASKREALILASHGVETYPGVEDLERSYCLASNTISVTTTGRSGLTYYWAKPTGWTLHTSDEWSESSGNFTYSGAFPASGSRVFRVTYAVGVSGWVSLTFWNFLVKVTKIPSGGAEADVAGSSVGGGAGYGGVSAFGVYFSSHSVSASTLVEIAPGDTLAFQYGSHVSTAGTYNTQFSTTNNGDGIVLSITPADIVS